MRDLCRTAHEDYGLHTVRAASSDANAASRAVLRNAGFVAVGAADPADIGGKVGTWYERDTSRGRGDAPQGS